SLTGCDLEEFAGTTKFKEDFEFAYDLEPGGRLSVESFNGSIDVQGWDQPRVEITGTRYAATRKLLEALEIDIVESDGAIRIRTVKPSGRRGNMGAAYTIRAPREVELERITSSNGSIHIEGIDGNAVLKTSNGRVRVVELNGDIEATTSNGSVQLEQTTGSAVLTTSNGSIKAEAVRGYFEAKTSNSSITAKVIETGDSRPMKLTTSNGNINLTMEENPVSDIRASTRNASITIQAPRSLAARVKASTSNGSISTDFDVAVEGGVRKKTRLEGAIGGGGPLVNLNSSNGNIRLKKLNSDS
ncbi:MAG: DUF4097 domain-containing protein, partial [bacterium]|nr:DUF4097 domain-containing protein [bacterium]